MLVVAFDMLHAFVKSTQVQVFGASLAVVVVALLPPDLVFSSLVEIRRAEPAIPLK